VILGLSALIRVLVISGVTIKVEYPVLLIVTGLSVLACRNGQVDALEGMVFLVVYVGFMGFSVVLARRVNPVEAAAALMLFTVCAWAADECDRAQRDSAYWYARMTQTPTRIAAAARLAHTSEKPA